MATKAKTGPGWGGSIIIPPKCQPSKAVSSDRTRSVIGHAYLRQWDGRWWLCATDSYVAVAVVVQIGGPIHEGYVPLGALKHIERGKPAKQIGANKWEVTLADHVEIYDAGECGPYPNFASLGVWENEAAPHAFSNDRPVEIGMRAGLLKNVSDALGAAHGIHLMLTGPLQTIRLSCPGFESERVAIQMPVRTA